MAVMCSTSDEASEEGGPSSGFPTESTPCLSIGRLDFKLDVWTPLVRDLTSLKSKPSENT